MLRIIVFAQTYEVGFVTTSRMGKLKYQKTANEKEIKLN